MEVVLAHHASLRRQAHHWLRAAERLASLDHLASGYAWQGVDHTLGLKIKESLKASIDYVLSQGKALDAKIRAGDNNLRAIKNDLIRLRQQYLRTEETVHFYTVAINSRTTPEIAALLRACDILCVRSMHAVLNPLGKEVPQVLTYVDKGVGAAILKAGLRLWDGRVSPVAAIKITQHNLFRPTAIIHETGHQVAHILGWNEALADLFRKELSKQSPIVAEAFASWSSEIAADAFAFVHAGYASVAALHDVVSGTPQSVFAYHQLDPHPISYVRVLMNIEMCRQSFGSGPWDDLQEAFLDDYNLDESRSSSAGLIRYCVSALPAAVKLILNKPMQCFGGRPLTALISPQQVSPRALERLEYLAGPSLYTSHAWIWNECIRLLALNGYRIGVGEGNLDELYKQQESWMTKLGFAVNLN